VVNVSQKFFAEFFGTLTLVLTVVGSGIMGSRLTNDVGVALLINTISTIFALALIVLVLGPISGAHLNPAVTLVMLGRRAISAGESFAFILGQVTGAIMGSVIANLMFDLPAIQIATQSRVTAGTLIGEVLATAGLLIVILVLVKRGLNATIGFAVAAWIGSAYFFTSSTSFANPAVTIGRVFSDTFAGIHPASVWPFIGAQLLGAGLGWLAANAIERADNSSRK
jgi:glycerol uptake facilitator-like aquaporin